MCGIVGIAAGVLNRNGKSLFEDLITVSNVRGRHGAGVAAVVDGKIKGAKSLYSGCDLLDMKGYYDLITENKISVLLGHTRWPTKGVTNDYTCVHPHFMKTVTGVHNGTLEKVNGRYIKDEESDSAAFYKHLDEEGIDEAIAYAKGAFCFVWIDHAAKTLNFLRNRERPLFLGMHKWGEDIQSLAWASESEMLEFAYKRKGMLHGLKIVELPINEIWTIPYNIPKGCKFEKQKNVLAGTAYWKPIYPNKSSETGWPFRGGKFRDEATNNIVPMSPRRGSFVWDGSKFLEKATIGTGKTQQVSLRRDKDVDELEGATKVRLPDGKGEDKGAPDEQRSKASKKVSLGNSGSAFVKNLVKGLEKHISETERDYIQEHYDEQKIEEDFAKLLAIKPDEDLKNYYETIKGHWVEESHYKSLLAFGCAWLGEPATMEDDIYWIDVDTYIFRDVLKDKAAVEDLSLVYPNDPYVRALKSFPLKDTNETRVSH